VPEKPQKQRLNWLLLIPMQVGPATHYARRVKTWMHSILVLQAVVCACRFVLLQDFSGSLWMSLVVGVGWYAIHQDMNITYVCVWGLLCLLNGVFNILALVLPLVFGLIRLQFLTMAMQICIPLVYLAGALFAWHLYHDYEQSLGQNVSSFDPMAKYVDHLDCDERTPLAAVGGFLGGVFSDGKGEKAKEVRAGVQGDVEAAAQEARQAYNEGMKQAQSAYAARGKQAEESARVAWQRGLLQADGFLTGAANLAEQSQGAQVAAGQRAREALRAADQETAADRVQAAHAALEAGKHGQTAANQALADAQQSVQILFSAGQERARAAAQHAAAGGGGVSRA